MQAKFVQQAQALLHGDMHTGSLMVTQDTTYAIDAEFAVYGPIAFDVGKFMANLLLAFFALDGHCNAADTRTDQRAWLYKVLYSAAHTSWMIVGCLLVACWVLSECFMDAFWLLYGCFLCGCTATYPGVPCAYNAESVL